MARRHTKIKALHPLLEFIKLQLAGNILFIGTLIGVFVADTILKTHPMIGLVTGSAVAHVIFFTINRTWVFKTDGARQDPWPEAIKFIAFMTFNFFLNILFVELARLLFAQAFPAYAAYAYYAGVLIASIFFAIWSFVGLKFWVFAPKPIRRHVRAARHPALTYEKKRKRTA